MRVIELQDNIIKISPEALGLAFFKVLWSRDKSKNKEQAHKDISYVYYFSDFNSPFYIHPPDQREGLIKEFALDDKAFKVDKDIEAAIVAYETLNKTPSMRMLEATIIAINKMDTYLRKVDYDTDDIDKVAKFIERLPMLMNSVNTAMEICKKETVGNTKVRGNATVGMFEDPK